MSKIFCFIALMLGMTLTSPAQALEVPNKTTTVQIQIPCKEPGFGRYQACVINNTAFEAPAPRNDVVIDRRLPLKIKNKYKRIAFIQKLHTKKAYRNPDGVVSVWEHVDEFIAQYQTCDVTDVTLAYTTIDGGKTWNGPNTPEPTVAFSMEY